MWSKDPSQTDSRQLFIVRPNASLSRHEGRLLFAGIAFFSLLIILRFYLLGAWLVIPFTLLDIIFVGLTLRYILKKNQYVELISCTQDKTVITKSTGNHHAEWSFQTFWVKLIYSPNRHPWHPGKLFLSSHGRSVEFGSCLTNDERKELAEAIQNSLDQITDKS